MTEMPNVFRKILTSFTILAFGLMSVFLQTSWAQVSLFSAQKDLPAVGSMVAVTDDYHPVMMRGLKLIPEKPFRFDFLMQTGQSGLDQFNVKDEALKLIRYFYASLTTPEQDMWVNLSPYEKDRIIPEAFAMTEMGRDLLAQDYILKQLTASLMHPEHEAGKIFWEKVYGAVYREFGSAEIPVETFNKVWILPHKAVVYAEDDQVYVVESSLKVMLEEDYLASQLSAANHVSSANDQQKMTDDIKEIIREAVIPLIEREVNEGKNFAPLRQIYHSLILAQWFKNHLKESVLGRLYVDQNKVSGINLDDAAAKQAIYEKYLESFKAGVYDLIKEEYDPSTQSIVPRKYFSGGMQMVVPLTETESYTDFQSVIDDNNAMLIVSADAKIMDAGDAQIVDKASLPKKTVTVQQSSVLSEIFKKLDFWNTFTISTVLLFSHYMLIKENLFMGLLITGIMWTVLLVEKKVQNWWQEDDGVPRILPLEPRYNPINYQPGTSTAKKEEFSWKGPASGWNTQLFNRGADDGFVQEIVASESSREISTKAGENLEQLAVIAALEHLIEDLKDYDDTRVVAQLRIWLEMVDNDQPAVMLFDSKSAAVEGREEFISAFLYKEGSNVPLFYVLEDILRKSMAEIFNSSSRDQLESIASKVIDQLVLIHQYDPRDQLESIAAKATEAFLSNLENDVSSLESNKRFLEFSAKSRLLAENSNFLLMEFFLQGAMEAVGIEDSQAKIKKASDFLSWPKDFAKQRLEVLGKQLSLDHLHKNLGIKLEIFTKAYGSSFLNLQNVRQFLKMYDPEVIPVGLPVMDQLQDKFSSLKGVLINDRGDFTMIPPDAAWKALVENYEKGEGASFARVFQFKEGPFSDIAVVEFYNDRFPARDQVLWEYKNKTGKDFLKSIIKNEELLKSLPSFVMQTSTAPDLKTYGYRVYDFIERKFVSTRGIGLKLKSFYQFGTLHRSDEHRIFVFKPGDPLVTSSSLPVVDVEDDFGTENFPAKPKVRAGAVRKMRLGLVSEESIRELTESDLFREFKNRAHHLKEIFYDEKLNKDNKILYDHTMSFKQYISSLVNYRIKDPDLKPIERVFLQTLLVEKGSVVSLVRFNNLAREAFTIKSYMWGWIQQTSVDDKLSDEFRDLNDNLIDLIEVIEEAYQKEDALNITVVSRKGYQMFKLTEIFEGEDGDVWGHDRSNSDILKYLSRELDWIIADLNKVQYVRKELDWIIEDGKRTVQNVRAEDIDDLLESIVKLPKDLQKYLESAFLTPSEQRVIKRLLMPSKKNQKIKHNTSLSEAAGRAKDFLDVRRVAEGVPIYDPEGKLAEMKTILRNIFNDVLVNISDAPGKKSAQQRAAENLGNSTPVDVNSLSEEKPASADNAVLGADPDAVGGIDLNPANIQFEEKGRGVNLMTPQDMNLIRNGLEGISPVIINIRPVSAAQILSQLNINQNDLPDTNAGEDVQETAILLGRQS